jgi:hypothetical protein
MVRSLLRTIFVVVVFTNLLKASAAAGFLSLDTQTPWQRKVFLKQSTKNGDVDNERLVARRIMYNQHCRKRQSISYQVIAAEACEPLARRMEWAYPDRFTYHQTQWKKFPDGTDEIEIGGFTPHNLISGEHVLFLASFHNNDVTLSQFQVMINLLHSFIESLTGKFLHNELHHRIALTLVVASYPQVVLPYSPVG